MLSKIKYNHSSIEKKWQSVWDKINLNTSNLSEAKNIYYNLMMFPYPSAEGLHIGNMYAFTGSDIHGRFKRLQGYEVFEPIGLDGFGIHSENFAIKINRHPMDHAQITEKNYYNQLKRIGAMFDWSRTVETYSPEYYKWTQWIFIFLFKYGLAYRKNADVNWCNSCKTVLADEQVIDDKCERCGNTVIKKPLEQWFFRITAYAEKLLNNSFNLNWSEKVKVAQQSWIGKKDGTNIKYKIYNNFEKEIGEIVCFTTRSDTNFGATFVVLSTKHKFIKKIVNNVDKKTADKINKYLKNLHTENNNEQIKSGVDTTLFCLNPLNNIKMPLYISNYVVSGFGTDAVVGVPAHDKRDFEFAKIFNLQVLPVVSRNFPDTPNINTIEDVYEGDGVVINSQFLNGLVTKEAKSTINKYLLKNKIGETVAHFHLRDWLISRQRYWGPPIPMIYCENCAKNKKSWFTSLEAKKFLGENLNSILEANLEWSYGWYPVDENDLPIKLPRIEDFKPDGTGKAPLSRHKEFYESKCPSCMSLSVRETDVSDTFLDSSWYFLRYPSLNPVNNNPDKSAWIKELTDKWLPVSMYTGGAEHSVLHLMYSRFISMVFYDKGLINFDEPFTNFFAHGLVIKDGAKMSKSKGNVINPDDYINLYGADALRLYLMFMGPFSQGGDFRDSAMEGMKRWVNRINNISKKTLAIKNPTQIQKNNIVSEALVRLILKLDNEYEKRRYNTAIAHMMEFTNLVEENDAILTKEELKQFIIVLSPFAPHLTEEIWQKINNRDDINNKSLSVHTQSWPMVSDIGLKELAKTIIVQVNGKTRSTLILNSHDAKNKDLVETEVQNDPKVSKFITGKIKKVIFVPEKIINFVI